MFCYIRLNAAHFHNGLYIVFLQVGGIPQSKLACSRWCLKLVLTLMTVVGNLEGANTLGLEFPIFKCPPKDIIPHFEVPLAHQLGPLGYQSLLIGGYSG